MQAYLLPIGLLTLSNLFMTTAWYWHLRHGSTDGKALPLIILTSWLIAFFEYCIMVPANRIGMFSAGFTVALAHSAPVTHGWTLAAASGHRARKRPISSSEVTTGAG